MLGRGDEAYAVVVMSLFGSAGPSGSGDDDGGDDAGAGYTWSHCCQRSVGSGAKTPSGSGGDKPSERQAGSTARRRAKAAGRH